LCPNVVVSMYQRRYKCTSYEVREVKLHSTRHDAHSKAHLVSRLLFQVSNPASLLPASLPYFLSPVVCRSMLNDQCLFFPRAISLPCVFHVSALHSSLFPVSCSLYVSRVHDSFLVCIYAYTLSLDVHSRIAHSKPTSKQGERAKTLQCNCATLRAPSGRLSHFHIQSWLVFVFT